MEKTAAEQIKFIKNWISKTGTTENLERLLHELEHKNVLHVDLVPEEIFHDLIGSNVSSIPMNMVPKLQEAYPGYDWNALARRGAAIINTCLRKEEV